MTLIGAGVLEVESVGAECLRRGHLCTAPGHKLCAVHCAQHPVHRSKHHQARALLYGEMGRGHLRGCVQTVMWLINDYLVTLAERGVV